MTSARCVPAGDHSEKLLLLIANSPESRIPEFWRMVVDGHHRGWISEEDFTSLSNGVEFRTKAFHARRRFDQHRFRKPGLEIAAPMDRRRRCQKRRRVWSGGGALHPSLRHYFTPGEQAVAAVIVAEVRKAGRCALPYSRIAKSAGLQGTTVVKRFVRLARKKRLIEVKFRPVAGGKNLPNVISIASSTWMSWINYGRHGEDIGGTAVPPDQIHSLTNRSEGTWAPPFATVVPPRNVVRGTETEALAASGEGSWQKLRPGGVARRWA